LVTALFYRRFGVRITSMAHSKKGFTIVELLLVAIVIAILASIAIPIFANSKDKAYVAQMKSDLRNLATYEEQYAADNGGLYFAGTAKVSVPLNGFHASKNVTITVTALPGPPPSWTAVATHAQTLTTCDMGNGVLTCS
jgi:prepilin-type N-terminal cleavage/methylation domain-containing protein